MFSPRPQASTPTSQGRFVFRAGPAVSCETPDRTRGGSSRWGWRQALRLTTTASLFPSKICYSSRWWISPPLHWWSTRYLTPLGTTAMILS